LIPNPFKISGDAIRFIGMPDARRSQSDDIIRAVSFLSEPVPIAMQFDIMIDSRALSRGIITRWALTRASGIASNQ
jgi:hypothetical protein